MTNIIKVKFNKDGQPRGREYSYLTPEQELKEKLRQAEQNFNYADPEYVDAAIYELNAAEERFRAMIREKKEGMKCQNVISTQ